MEELPLARYVKDLEPGEHGAVKLSAIRRTVLEENWMIDPDAPVLPPPVLDDYALVDRLGNGVFRVTWPTGIAFPPPSEVPDTWFFVTCI
jgi:hypothetical protein